MALCAGCDDRCPVMEIRHEVVSVTMSSENSYQFSKCVDSGDCQQLCVETAMARSPYASAVDECSRVDSDGGVDGGSNAGMLQVTLAITYRVFEFCGA
jgi:hypothetical protein